ncbi:MAG: DUF4416 family protein [Candidatus Omnitrophota bacterium]
MGRPGRPERSALFVGMLSGYPELFDAVTRILVRKFGPVDLESEVIPFDFTDYYTSEMGAGLQRKFVAFQRPILPDMISEIKVFTNRLERKYSQGEKRRINLDPGYLTSAKIVLVSTKNFSHRIYLGRGIYAEITFICHKDRLEPLPWTYPDYRTEAYLRFFQDLRKLAKTINHKVKYSNNIQ